MANVQIYQLDNAGSDLDNSALLAMDIPNPDTSAASEVPYVTRKASVSELETQMLQTDEYTTALDTTNTTIVGAINEQQSVIGYSYDAYDDTSTYAVGDLCIYNNALYKCTTAITTAEAWNASHWTATSIADEINELNEYTEYSNNEHIVGTWTDGKPIYRKVLTGNITQGTYLTKDLGEYTDTITKIEVIISKPSTNIWLCCPFRNEVGNDYYQGYLFVNQSIPKNSNTTTINVLCESSASGYFDNCVAQIVIEYTKP